MTDFGSVGYRYRYWCRYRNIVINIRILLSGSTARDKGIPETLGLLGFRCLCGLLGPDWLQVTGAAAGLVGHLLLLLGGHIYICKYTYTYMCAYALRKVQL